MSKLTGARAKQPNPQTPNDFMNLMDPVFDNNTSQGSLNNPLNNMNMMKNFNKGNGNRGNQGQQPSNNQPHSQQSKNQNLMMQSQNPIMQNLYNQNQPVGFKSMVGGNPQNIQGNTFQIIYPFRHELDE